MASLPPAGKYLIYLLLLVTIVFICIFLKNLLVPLFFAVLFAYLLFPASSRLESFGMPRIITNLLLITTTILALSGLIYGGGVLVSNFTENLSNIKDQLEQNLQFFQHSLGNILGISEDRIDSSVESFGGSVDYILNFFTATTNAIVAFGLIPVYTFLLLLYRNKFRTFLNDITPQKGRPTVDRVVEQISHIVPKYLKGLIMVVIILMFINSTIFWAIGLNFPILLGVIAALFNIIPYLGTVLGFAAVLLVVLATQEPSLALWVIIVFFPVQFFENNILTPNITGAYVQINPLVIILSLIAGAMMWGLPGMLMVIPFLAMIKIIFENIEKTKPIAFLISANGVESYTPSMSKIKVWVTSVFK